MLSDCLSEKTNTKNKSAQKLLAKTGQKITVFLVFLSAVFSHSRASLIQIKALFDMACCRFFPSFTRPSAGPWEHLGRPASKRVHQASQ